MISNRKGGNEGAKYIDEADEDIEEYRRHMDLIVDECKEIRSNTTMDTKNVFQASIEYLDAQTEFIRKNELRINNNNQTEILKLNKIANKKKLIATELRSVIEQVKNLDYENKSLQNEIVSLTNKYEDMVKDITGSGQCDKIKAAVAALKKQAIEMKLNEGVMNGALFSCAGMHHGKHHLYDDLDNEITNNNKQKRKQNNKKAKKHVYTTEEASGSKVEQEEYEEDNFEKEFD